MAQSRVPKALPLWPALGCWRSDMSQTRRLAAILAGDVAGYSRLVGLGEEGTHERLRADLRQLVEPKISEHKRRIVKNTDDGVLAEFARVVDVVGRGGVDGGLHRHSFAVDQGVDQICTTSGSAPLSRTEARPRSVGVKSVARDVGDPVAAHARSP